MIHVKKSEFLSWCVVFTGTLLLPVGAGAAFPFTDGASQARPRTCEVSVPPEAVEEPEPCGGQTNGGCGLNPPAFTPVFCGQTARGTAWSGTGDRDTDWYELILTEPASLTWQVEAEFPPLIILIDSNDGDCAGYTFLDYAEGLECEPVSVTANCVPPGLYWLWIGSQAWEDVPCTLDYIAKLECAPCLPSGDLNCDGAVGMEDIPAFVLALLDPSEYAGTYPDCDPLQADLNHDGAIAGDDVQPFVAGLLGR